MCRYWSCIMKEFTGMVPYQLDSLEPSSSLFGVLGVLCFCRFHTVPPTHNRHYTVVVDGRTAAFVVGIPRMLLQASGGPVLGAAIANHHPRLALQTPFYLQCDATAT